MNSAFGGQGVAPGSGAQLQGHGYGELQLASPEVQQQLAGKPPHFDTHTGVYFDGQQAFVYVASPDQQAGAEGPGEGPQVHAVSSTTTAYESDHVVLGNGTVGDLEEHRNAASSAYLMDDAAAVLAQQ